MSLALKVHRTGACVKRHTKALTQNNFYDTLVISDIRATMFAFDVQNRNFLSRFCTFILGLQRTQWRLFIYRAAVLVTSIIESISSLITRQKLSQNTVNSVDLTTV